MNNDASARAATRSAFAAAAGLAGALLITGALVLDRATAGPPGWEGPLAFDAAWGEFLPRHTFPIARGRTAAVDLVWTGGAPARLGLHVRDDDGRCLGERSVELPAAGDGRAAVVRIPLRAAMDGPHTLVWTAADPPGGSLTLRVRPRAPLPFVPLAAAAAVFGAAGVGGTVALVYRRGRRSRRAVATGTLLGIALALGALAAAGRLDAPLALLKTGFSEEPP
jgi:hypothetical protein